MAEKSVRGLVEQGELAELQSEILAFLMKKGAVPKVLLQHTTLFEYRGFRFTLEMVLEGEKV